jgi:hypothetical protein
MFIPDPTFSIPYPGSRVDKIPEPDLHQIVLVFLTQHLIRVTYYSKFSKVRYEMFIPDPGSGFFTILGVL